MSAGGPGRDRVAHLQEERLARLRRLLGAILDTAARTGRAADLPRVLEELEAALDRIEALGGKEARGRIGALDSKEAPDRGEAPDPFLEDLRRLLDEAPGGRAEEPL